MIGVATLEECKLSSEPPRCLGEQVLTKAWPTSRGMLDSMGRCCRSMLPRKTRSGFPLASAALTSPKASARSAASPWIFRMMRIFARVSPLSSMRWPYTHRSFSGLSLRLAPPPAKWRLCAGRPADPEHASRRCSAIATDCSRATQKQYVHSLPRPAIRICSPIRAGSTYSAAKQSPEDSFAFSRR